MRTLVIVNPQSHSGATGRRWSAIERDLRGALGPIEVEATRGPRDAEHRYTVGELVGMLGDVPHRPANE